MRRFFVTAGVTLFFIAANTAAQFPARLINGGFETPENAGGNLVQTHLIAGVEGWQTIGGSQIKIARSDVNASLANSAFGTSAAADGGQFLVLDHNTTGVLYQTISTIGGDKLSWSLSHKGRNGTGHIEVWIGTYAEVVTRAAGQYAAVSGQHNVSRVDQNLRARIKQLWSGTDHPTERCDREIITEHNVMSPNNGWVRYRGEYTVPIGQTETVIAIVSVSGNNLLDAVDFVQGESAGTYRVTVRPSVGGHSVVEYGGDEFSTAGNNTVVVEPKKGERVTVNIHVADSEGYIRRGAIVRRGDSEDPNGAYVMPFPAEAAVNPLATSVVYTAGSGTLDGDIDITPVFSKDLSVIVNPVGGTYSGVEPSTDEVFTFTSGSDSHTYTIGRAERLGYRFAGWKVVGTNAYDGGDNEFATNADGTILSAGESIKIDDIYLIAVGQDNKRIAPFNNGFNLQAVYELIPVQPLIITLNHGAGGIYKGRPEPLSEVGSSPLTISMDAGNTAYTLAEPVRPGYDFVGWTLGAADIGKTPVIGYADNIDDKAQYSINGGASSEVPVGGIAFGARWSTQKSADLALEYEYRYQVRQCDGAFTNDSAQIPIFNGQTLHLPSQKFGYNNVNARQKITVTNAGSSQTGTLNITRSGDDMAMFEIVNQAGTVIPNVPFLTADQSAMFFIRPTAAATAARPYKAALTVTDGAGFTITINIEFEVEARRVTISGLKVYDKYFDGTNEGWVNTSAAVIMDADTKTSVSDPNLSINTNEASAIFRDKMAGTVDTNILISGITLDGSTAGNYSLAGVQERMRAEITPRPIIGVTRNAGPPEKVYNGDREVSVVNGDYTFRYDLKHWETSFTPAGEYALGRNTDYAIELFFDPVTTPINGKARGNSAYVGDNLSYTYSVAFVDVTDKTKNFTLAGFNGSGTGGKITKSENFRADPVTVIVEKGREGEPITYHLTQDLKADRLFIVYHYGESTGPRTFHGALSSKFNWSPGDNVLTGQPDLTGLSDSTIVYTGSGQSSGVTTMTLTVESHNYVDIPAVIRFQATDLLPMYTDDIKFDGRDEVYDGHRYTLHPAEMLNEEKYLVAGDEDDKFKYEYAICGRHWWHDGWDDDREHASRINHGFDNVTVLVTNATHYGQKRVRHSVRRRPTTLDYFTFNIPARIYNESAQSIANAVFKTDSTVGVRIKGGGKWLKDSLLTGMGTPRLYYGGSRVPPTNAGEYTISFPVTLGANFTSASAATMTPTAALNPPTPGHEDNFTSRNNPYRIHKKSLAGTEAVCASTDNCPVGTIAAVEITGRHDYRPADVPNYDTDGTTIILTPGQAVTPGVEYVTVELAGFNGGDPLRHGAGMDYTYTASNNHEVTIDETNGQAIVTVIGVNNFKDQAEGKFSVRKAAPALSHFKFETVPHRVYDGTRARGIGESSIVSTVYGMGEVGDVRYAGSLNQPLDAGPYRVTINIDEGKNFLASPNLFLITHNVTKRPPMWDNVQFKRASDGDVDAASAGDSAKLAGLVIPEGDIYDGTQKGIVEWVPDARYLGSMTGMGAMTILYNGSSTRPRNAGTYTVTLRVAEGRNFLTHTFTIGNYTIAPRSLFEASDDGKIEIVTKIDTTIFYDIGKQMFPLAADVTVTLPALEQFWLPGVLNGLSLMHGRDFTVTADNNTDVTKEEFLPCKLRDPDNMGCVEVTSEDRENEWAKLIVKGAGNFKDEVFGYFVIELGHPDSSHFNSSVTGFNFTAPATLTNVYNGLGQGVGTVSIKPDIGMGALKESELNPGTPKVLYDTSETLPVNVNTYAVTVGVDLGVSYREKGSVRLGRYSITRKTPELKDFVFRMIETKGEGGEPDVYKYELGSQLADVIPTDHIYNRSPQGIVWELASHLAMPVGVEESDDPSAEGRMTGMGTTRNIEYQREGTSTWITDKPVNAGTYNVRVVTNQGSNFNAADGLALGTYTIAPRDLGEFATDDFITDYDNIITVKEQPYRDGNLVTLSCSDLTVKLPAATSPLLPGSLNDMTLSCGETPAANTDYTFAVTGTQQQDVTEDGDDQLTVTITGHRNFTGTAEFKFDIVRTVPRIDHFAEYFNSNKTHVYNGQIRGIGAPDAVVASVEGMGDVIAVWYYPSNGGNDPEDPVNAGLDDVWIDIEQGSNYSAAGASGLFIGVYEITKKAPALADFMFKNMKETEDPEIVVRGGEDEEGIVHPVVETGHTYNRESQGIGWNLNTDVSNPNADLAASMSGMGTRVIEYKRDGSSVWTADHPTAAGTYNVRINVSTAGNNFEADTVPLGAYTIDRKSVTITGIKSKDKIYDGNRTAIIDTGGSAISGKYEYDDLVIDTSAAAAFFDTKDVGLSKEVTFSDFKLGGADAANYTLSAQPIAVKADITPRPLTVTPNAGHNKTYSVPADVDPTLTYVVTDENPTPMISPEAWAWTGSLSRTPGENAGNYPINLGNLEPADNESSGFLASNYQLVLSSSVVNFEIKKAAVELIEVIRFVPFGDISTRTYNVSALVSQYALASDNLNYTIGTLSGDVGILAPASVLSAVNGVSYRLVSDLSEDDVGKTAVIPVTVSGLNNYEDITVNLTLKITDKTVTEIIGVSIDDKVYDGAAVSPDIKGLVVRDYDTKIPVTDDLSLVYNYTGTHGTTYNSTAAPEDAGSYSLVISISDNDPVYEGESKSIPFTITKRPLTPSVSFTDVTGKIFDGNTTITSIVQPTITLSGAVFDESPAASAVYVFVDENAGTNKGVNVTDIALTGNPINDNYVLSKDTLNNRASGLEITKKDIAINTVEAPSKPYDGNLDVARVGEVTFTGEILPVYGLVLGTDYTVTAAYIGSSDAGIDNRNYRYTVTMLNTTKANNYNLNPTTKDSTNGTITPLAAPPIIFPTAAPITYGDSLKHSTLSVTSNDYGTFTWTNPNITPAFSQSGNEFEVTFTPNDNNNDWSDVILKRGVSVTISKKTLTPSVSFTDVTGKVFDGNTTITSAVQPTITLTGAVFGQSPAASANYVFVDENAGANKNVNVSNIALTGIAVNDNYVLSTNALNNAASGLAITRAAGSFGTPNPITITYMPGLTLADLYLPPNYTWNDLLTTALTWGADQSIAATYTHPSENYNPAVGNVTVNLNVDPTLPIYLRFLNPSHDNSPAADTAHGQLLTGRQRYNVLVQVLRADGEPLTGIETDITISFVKGGEKIEKVVTTDPATGIVTYSLVLVSSSEEDIPFQAWMNAAGGTVAKDFALLEVREVVSVAGSNRVIPPGNKVDSGASEPALELANEITAGPNPVRKGLSSVNFYRQGKQINDATLIVFDAMGNIVNKIKISDKSAGGSLSAPTRRIVGLWDLKDSRGKAVPEGTYLIRGAVTTRDGKRETVSLMLGVR